MTTPLIAVLGENLVDLLVSPDGTVNAVIGGGPLNVARTIGRLGAEAYFVSGVSSDAFGHLVRAALDDSGVHLVVEREFVEPTSLAVVELNPTGPSYHFHLDATAAFALDATETIVALRELPDIAALYFGTLGALVEPMASLGEELVARTAPQVVVVVDPNCRPSAVRDHEAYRSRIARLAERADVMKVSTEDLTYLHPKLAPLDGAQELLAQGAASVIVTDGADPVHVISAHGTRRVAVAPVDIVDTVGAGDALVGGFLTWWTGHGLTRADVHDLDLLAEAVAAAVDISRLTCQRAGAQPPDANEVRHRPGWSWLAVNR